MRTLEAPAAGWIAPAPGKDVNLLAGQLYFSGRGGRVKTLLGSCVAVTLWNPQRHLGGMCHFLLPKRDRQAGDPCDGRYGDEALHVLVETLRRAGTQPRDYQAHLYGGADTLPDSAGVKLNVGERNIEQGWALIDHYGFSLCEVDVGDHVPRNVLLSLADGHVVMKRGAPVKGR